MEIVSVSPEAKSSNPWVLVTGGARRVGAAIVRELHRREFNVMIHCLGSLEEAGKLAHELEQGRKGSVAVLQADLCDPEGPASLAEQVRTISPKIELLVNNASRFYPTPLGGVSADDWNDLVDSNVRGAFFLTQALIPELQGGAVVNIVDIHARRPMPKHPVYSMAKAALEMMTRSLALELAPSIRVNGVAPGAILWPESAAVPASESSGGDAQQQDILDRVALGRLGNPADIAGAVAYLGLDAPYVTGQILAVDGGRSLNI